MAWQAGPHPDDRPIDAEAPAVWRPRRTPVVVRPRADTPQAVALELLPLLPVLLSMMSVLFAGGWSIAAVVALAIPVAVVQMVVAALDLRVLSARGFTRLPSALTAFVSPVLYLWLRARRCEAHDPDARDPVRWAVGTTVVAIAMVAIGQGFTLAIAPLFAL